MAKSPEQWLAYLEPKLVAQQQEIKIYEDYYAGRHRLLFATLKFRQAFGFLFSALADNWCELVVDAPVERLFVNGFRFGEEEAVNKGAWATWQANRLDAESVIAHTEAVKDGRSYILIAPPKVPGEKARITVEHAAQMIVEHAAGERRERLAALKKWRDDEGYEYATLYLPDEVFKWQTKEPIPVIGAEAAIVGDRAVSGGVEWTEREGGGANPLGVVPVIPLYNNPSMLGEGRSDLKSVIPLQDAINKTIADMLIASEFAAFPQRVIIGAEVPRDPQTGLPTKATELKAAINRFWAFEGENVKVSEFAAADLGNYVKAITLLLQHLAAQTRTPPHYLLGQIVNASGDALKAAEIGLVAKVKRKQQDFADSWEEAIELALQAEGGDRPEGEIETIWGDPEYRSEGEQVDAAIKLRALGVPVEALWERIGATPQQVADWRKRLDENKQPPMPLVPGEPAPPATGEPPLPEATIQERNLN